MEENCASGITLPLVDIVVEHNAYVVQAILAFQGLRAGWIGQTDKSVIVSVVRFIAPSVMFTNLAHWQLPAVSVEPILSKQAVDQLVSAARCFAIALNLACADACTAKRA